MTYKFMLAKVTKIQHFEIYDKYLIQWTHLHDYYRYYKRGMKVF